MISSIQIVVRLGRLPPPLRGVGFYGLMFDYAHKHQFVKALPPGFSVVISHPDGSQAQPRLRVSLLFLARLLLSTRQSKQHCQETAPSSGVVGPLPALLSFALCFGILDFWLLLLKLLGPID